MSDPIVCTMCAADIVRTWAPGSRSEGWTWAQEAAEVVQHPSWDDVVTSIAKCGYEDREDARIVLGHDRRVWDGHHRIVYMALMDPLLPLPVEITQKEGQ